MKERDPVKVVDSDIAVDEITGDLENIRDQFSSFTESESYLLAYRQPPLTDKRNDRGRIVPPRPSKLDAEAIVIREHTKDIQ